MLHRNSGLLATHSNSGDFGYKQATSPHVAKNNLRFHVGLFEPLTRASFVRFCPLNNVLRLAIVDPCDATRDALKTMLLGMDMIWLEAECSRYEFFTDVIAQTHPDIGLVAMDNN